MAAKNSTTINLIVGRQERTIFINTILYAKVQDKLCTIYLTRNESVSVFLSIAALEALLPEDAFLKASRSCLVALQYIQRIDETAIILFNSDRIPFSRRQKTAVYQAFQQYLATRTGAGEVPVWRLDLFSEFSCLNHCPFSFCIFEVTPLAEKGRQDYHIRYANEAMASALHLPVPRLIEVTFTEPLQSRYESFLRVVARTALSGGCYEQYQTNFTSERSVHIAFYQPHYGFCACIFIPDSRNAAH